MTRVYAVGDVHGCVAELATLLADLPLGVGDTVVFLGDYLDRGPDSRGVIELLLGWAPAGVERVFLRGNHEDMCLAYLGAPGHWGEAWAHNGAAATARSYGFAEVPSAAALAERMPPAHREFLADLRLSHHTHGHLFVHAGVRPHVPLAAQDSEDLLWIREEFLRGSHGLPYTVVFGHTPMRQALVQLPEKIGIDTGCVYGGHLTAVEVVEGTLHQVRSGDRQAVRSALTPRA